MCTVSVRTIGEPSRPHSSITLRQVISPYPLKTEIAAYSRSRKRSPGCGQMAVTPLRITGSAPPGSPRQTVWWPTRTPATSVMALWVPVGRNPTGIPKSRALPRAGGGDDTDQLGFVAELLQLDVRVDLDVPVTIPARLDKDVVVDEPGGEDPGDQQQIVDLLLAECDGDSHQPDDGRRRPERHFPGPRQIALREAADQG